MRYLLTSIGTMSNPMLKQVIEALEEESNVSDLFDSESRTFLREAKIELEKREQWRIDTDDV